MKRIYLIDVNDVIHFLRINLLINREFRGQLIELHTSSNGIKHLSINYKF